jgi:hypothetical protein
MASHLCQFIFSRKRKFADVDDTEITQTFDANDVHTNDVFPMKSDDDFVDDTGEDDFAVLSKMITEAGQDDQVNKYEIIQNVDKEIYYLNDFIKYIWLV